MYVNLLSNIISSIVKLYDINVCKSILLSYIISRIVVLYDINVCKSTVIKYYK